MNSKRKLSTDDGSRNQIWLKVMYGLLLVLKFIAEAVGGIYRCLLYCCSCLEKYLLKNTQTAVEQSTSLVLEIHDYCKRVLENTCFIRQFDYGRLTEIKDALVKRRKFDDKLLTFVLFLHQEIVKNPEFKRGYAMYLKSLRRHCMTWLLSSGHSPQSFVLLHVCLHRIHLSIPILVGDFKSIEGNVISISTIKICEPITHKNIPESVNNKLSPVRISNVKYECSKGKRPIVFTSATLKDLQKDLETKLVDDIKVISTSKITEDKNFDGLLNLSIVLNDFVTNIPEDLPENIFDSEDNDEAKNLTEEDPFPSLSSEIIPAYNKVTFSSISHHFLDNLPNSIGNKVLDVKSNSKHETSRIKIINGTSEKKTKTTNASTHEGSNLSNVQDSLTHIFESNINYELKKCPVVESQLSEIENRTSQDQINPRNVMPIVPENPTLNDKDEAKKTTTKEINIPNNFTETLKCNSNISKDKIKQITVYEEVYFRENKQVKTGHQKKLKNITVEVPHSLRCIEFNITQQDNIKVKSKVRVTTPNYKENTTESKPHHPSLRRTKCPRGQTIQVKEENVTASNSKNIGGSKDGKNFDPERPGISWFLTRRGISYDDFAKNRFLHSYSSFRSKPANVPLNKIVIDLEDKKAISLLKPNDDPCDEYLELELLFYFALKGEIVVSARPKKWLTYTSKYFTKGELQKDNVNFTTINISIYNFVLDFCELKFKNLHKYNMSFYYLKDNLSYAVGFDGTDEFSAEDYPTYPLELPLCASTFVPYYDWELPVENDDADKLIAATEEKSRKLPLATTFCEFTVGFGTLPESLQKMLKIKYPDWYGQTSVVVQFPVLTPQEISEDNGKQFIFFNWWKHYVSKSVDNSKPLIENAFVNFLKIESKMKNKIQAEKSKNGNDASTLQPYQEIDLQEPLMGEDVKITPLPDICSAKKLKDTFRIPSFRYGGSENCPKIVDVKILLSNFQKLKLQKESMESMNVESNWIDNDSNPQKRAENVIKDSDHSMQNLRRNNQNGDVKNEISKSSSKKRRRNKHKKTTRDKFQEVQKEQMKDMKHLVYDETQNAGQKEGIQKDTCTGTQKRETVYTEKNETVPLEKNKFKEIEELITDVSNANMPIYIAVDKEKAKFQKERVTNATKRNGQKPTIVNNEINDINILRDQPLYHCNSIPNSYNEGRAKYNKQKHDVIVKETENWQSSTVSRIVTSTPVTSESLIIFSPKKQLISGISCKEASIPAIPTHISTTISLNGVSTSIDAPTSVNHTELKTVGHTAASTSIRPSEVSPSISLVDNTFLSKISIAKSSTVVSTIGSPVISTGFSSLSASTSFNLKTKISSIDSSTFSTPSSLTTSHYSTVVAMPFHLTFTSISLTSTTEETCRNPVEESELIRPTTALTLLDSTCLSYTTATCRSLTSTVATTNKAKSNCLSTNSKGVLICLSPTTVVSTYLSPATTVSTCTPNSRTISTCLSPTTELSTCLSPTTELSTCLSPPTTISICVNYPSTLAFCIHPPATLATCHNPPVEISTWTSSATVSTCISPTKSVFTYRSPISSNSPSLTEPILRSCLNGEGHLSTKARRSADQRQNLTVAERLSNAFLKHTSVSTESQPTSLSVIKKSVKEGTSTSPEEHITSKHRTESIDSPNVRLDEELFTKETSANVNDQSIHFPPNKLSVNSSDDPNIKYSKGILQISASTSTTQQKGNASSSDHAVNPRSKQKRVGTSNTLADNFSPKENLSKISHNLQTDDSDSSSSDSSKAQSVINRKSLSSTNPSPTIRNERNCKEMTKMLVSNRNENTTLKNFWTLDGDSSSNDYSENQRPIERKSFSQSAFPINTHKKQKTSKNALKLDSDASSSDNSLNSSPVAKYKFSSNRQKLRLDVAQKLTEIMRRKVETMPEKERSQLI